MVFSRSMRRSFAIAAGLIKGTTLTTKAISEMTHLHLEKRQRQTAPLYAQTTMQNN